ncbi:hypothetical protein QW131_24950 [Roseibium salinum]|nr:hypothetical protein [Roseibium salinum]
MLELLGNVARNDQPVLIMGRQVLERFAVGFAGEVQVADGLYGVGLYGAGLRDLRLLPLTMCREQTLSA